MIAGTRDLTGDQAARLIGGLQLGVSKASGSMASGWTTAASPVSLFTVTGDVLARVHATVQTTIASTSNTGTIAVGVTGNTGVFIAATTMDATNCVAGVTWVDATATLKAEALAGTSGWVLIAGGADIIATIATNNMTAGAAVFYCDWIKKSADGLVVAA
jgi:hypothetical protein